MSPCFLPAAATATGGEGRTEDPAADQAPITVAVGRHEPLLLLGLVGALSEDPRVRVLATDLGAGSLERSVEQRAPRVVVLDEAVENSLLERLTAREPPTGVVVLAHNPTRTYGLQVLAAGATCVARNLSLADILAAVHLAARGGRRFVSGDGRRIEPRCPNSSNLLTPREREMLEYRRRGDSHGQIALAMGIRVGTVNKHAASICRKLGLRSTRELIGTPRVLPSPTLRLTTHSRVGPSVTT